MSISNCNPSSSGCDIRIMSSRHTYKHVARNLHGSNDLARSSSGVLCSHVSVMATMSKSCSMIYCVSWGTLFLTDCALIRHIVMVHSLVFVGTLFMVREDCSCCFSQKKQCRSISHNWGDLSLPVGTPTTTARVAQIILSGILPVFGNRISQVV